MLRNAYVSMVFLGLTLFMTEKAYSQKSDNVDSLIRSLANENIIKERYQTLIKIGDMYHDQRDYLNALLYFEKALLIARHDTDKVVSQLRIGRVYVDSTNYSNAQIHLKKALSLIEKAGEINYFPTAYNLSGMCYGLTNNLDSAIIAFENAKKYNLIIPDSSGLGYSYYNIGLAYHFKGLYDKATENFIRSAEIRRILSDTTAYVTSLTSLGEVFRIQKDYKNALKYYTEAIHSKASIKSKETLAYIYSEFALIYKNTEEYDTSLAYIDTAMTYCEDIQYKRGIATLTAYKASIMKILENYEEALRLYDETIIRYEDINFEIGLVQSNVAIAEIYFEEALYTKALEKLNKVAALAKNNNLLEEQTDISELKYKIFKETGRHKKALDEVETYLVLKDSLFNLKKEEKIREIENIYQAEKKDHEIELLKTEDLLNKETISKQNMRILLLVVLLAIMLISSAIILIVFLQRNKAYKALVQRNIEIFRLEEKKPEKQDKLNISNEQKIVNDLLCLIEENRYFLNSSCSIENLAKEINTNRQYLSQIINKKFKSNFNSFINKYRVKEARKLLLDDSYHKYTIDAIAELCGFNNRATFNSAFKKSTGVTPNYFKKNSVVV